ncbi:Sds3-like-domain-containing protein [Tuber indicum]|nr:Sds3-like-domain-containing protein [Tuber indicum]
MASPSPSPPSLSPTPHPNQLPPPTAPPQSKRDKRRHALSEKLTALTTSFHNPTNPRVRDLHYRAQLASIQADIHLITKCDASGRDMRLLDDSPERIQVQVNEELERMGLSDLVSSANGARAGTGPGAAGKEDASGVGVTGMAGRWYGQFIEAVNEGMEERDAQLSLLHNNYNHKVASLEFQHKRSIVLARSEHQSLTNTIQTRLMARLKTQLKKLAAEKESTSSAALSSLSALSTSVYTDLTETNALLLHPSQFGMVPCLSSPSRPTEEEKETRRKPRRRAGEVEELLSFGVGINFDLPSSTSKRKRAARRDREEIEETHTPPIHEAASPSSSSAIMNFDPSSSSQQKIDREALRRKREELLKQVYAPVYSFDKLFTEKELQMAGNQASLAAVRFFTERPQMHYDDGDSEEDNVDPGIVTPHPELEIDEEVSNGNYNTRSNPPRHTREIESLVLNGVPGFGTTFVNKAGVAPPPPALRSEEADADLAAMRGEVVRNGDGEREGKKVRRN